MEVLNSHHILWTKRNWRKGYAGKLRSHWYFKIAIPLELHRYIHANMVGIPRCNEAMCEAALYQMKLLEGYGVLHKSDSLKIRLELLICILDTGQSETAEALKQELTLVEHFDPG